MFLLQLVLATAAVVVPCAAPIEMQEFDHNASAVLHENRLIHLDEKGRIHVWRLQDGSFDAVGTAKLARNDLTYLASDGKQLWAVGASKVYRWSAQEAAWKGAGNFHSQRDAVKGLVVVGGVPLLVLETGVMNPATKRMYPFPGQDEFQLMKTESTLHIGPDVDGNRRRFFPEDYSPASAFPPPLRDAVAMLGTESRLWIGTSGGERGGTLYGLDPANGRWVEYGRSGMPATGMTRDESGKLIVSWSMSHWGEATRISEHGPDAEPSQVYRVPGSKYYQTVAFNPFDNRLYAVEQRDVVTIAAGSSTKIAELDGPVYGKEIHALGVAPGISGLLPFAPGALIVVPKSGMPWLLNDGKLTRLTRP